MLLSLILLSVTAWSSAQLVGQTRIHGSIPGSSKSFFYFISVQEDISLGGKAASI
jgi:hypothetical protein